MPTFQRGDVSLHYELDGSGPPAVYICGMGSHSNDFLSMMIRQALSPHYTLLTVDNRGAGQTTTSGKTTLADMAEDIVAVMHHHQMDAVAVLGISMGGMIGLTLAVNHPEKVRRQVIAVSCAYAISEPNRSGFILRKIRDMRDQSVPLEAINIFNAYLVLGESVFSDYPELVEAFVNAPPDPLQMGREGFELQMGALEGYDVREQLKQCSIPTLVMSSPEDLLIPPRFQDEIAACIPNATIKRYPGGHVFMMLPAYAAQFFKDVLSFWNSIV
ncbi:MAG: alpha/beta hydrolase [Anaerolineae bacterium]